MILFHGFGQDHSIFQSIIHISPEVFTYYLMDDPYHGRSTRENENLNSAEWKELFSSFLTSENIDSFSIGGYSLGGRFALVTAYQFTSRVKKLYLIAPDGIYKNRWYYLATGAGKGIFKYLMKNPSIFFKLLDLLDEKKWIKPSISKFARQELEPKENRIRVYQSWVYLKPLGVAKSSLIRRFNQHKLAIELLLGSDDRIVPPEKITPTFNKIKSTRTEILPLKHHHLVEAMITWIN